MSRDRNEDFRPDAAEAEEMTEDEAAEVEEIRAEIEGDRAAVTAFDPGRTSLGSA